MDEGGTSLSTSDGNGYGNYPLQPKHKVFLSHSGAQKGFVEQLCVDLERCDRHPFFDKRRECLPIGKEFPSLIFEAIEQCEVGVVVLSEEFFTSKWPMLELVAMVHVKRRKPSFTIMPVFLDITFSKCRDVDKHKGWLSLWHAWAKCDSRIDVKEWENALRLFGPTNGLKYNIELGEVKFREEIVEAICKLVPSGSRFEDSHVQGRSRLCKVIHETIEESRVSSLHGVCIVGLYGVGGIGKTTICKAMCNELSKEYREKVCYVELGSQSEEEVFKEVLGRLTDKNLDYLGPMDVDKYRYHLMRDMMNIKVFLTIDNVSSATTNQALTLLRANYGLGSVLLVTARSLNEFISLQIDGSECMEMPELELDEARSLFLYHVVCIPPTYSSNKDDLDVISSCIKRCHFKKGDGVGYHYHPLALRVLGEQLRSVGYVPTRWCSLLHEIDFLNPFGEPQHPMFSILRRSFDALNPQDQLLFMDIVLFSPYRHLNIECKWSIFEWLGMVHGICVNSVIERLENLKRKSLLENLGDGFGRIGIHDLWLEFARLEIEVGRFEDRRWIYEWNKSNVFGVTNLTWGGGLVNLRRMFFMESGFRKLKDVDFYCFSNMTVLKVYIGNASAQDVDLRSLKQLKSLELECCWYPRNSKPLISIVGLSSLLQLGFLRWLNFPSSPSCINEISCLRNLRVLELYERNRAPNLTNLILLEVVSFHENVFVTTIRGLSSNHTNLKILDLSLCKALESCPNVSELVALQELHLKGCSKLKVMPNLEKLKRLEKMDVRFCKLLRALPGLGDLDDLVELHASYCSNLAKLPNMYNLKNLRILDLGFCCLIKSLPGLDELVCLQSLKMRGCTNFTQLPNIYKLSNLQTLELDLEVPLQYFSRWSNSILLHGLEVDVLYDGLDLHSLTKLERLHIFGWQGRGISNLVELVSLEYAIVVNCRGVRVLPDLKRLSRLHNLKFMNCEFEDLSGLCNLTSLEKLDIMDCNKLEVLPDLQELANLDELKIKGCALLRDLCGIFGLQNLKSLWVSGNSWLPEKLGPNLHRLTNLRDLHVLDCGDLQWLSTCSQLHSLDCSGCSIKELPDLANFPRLSVLCVSGCVNLMNLTCSVPLCPNFAGLDISGCKRLQALPNLTNLQNLRYLYVANSGVVLSVEFIQSMRARWRGISWSTNETSYRVQSQRNSHRLWDRSIGMISSLHCGCSRTSLAITHSS